MLSRAHLLIERDYERLIKDCPWGIEAFPLHEDNLFEWSVKLLGLQETQWEGGVFRLYIKFDEYYNKRPPEVCFHTIPFHPNVDMITGRPCIDFLDDWSQWKDNYTFCTLLLAVQTMLSNPVIENSVNTEAARMYKLSPHAYQQMVSECITASQRLEADLAIDAGSRPVTVQDSNHMTVRFGVPEKPSYTATSQSAGQPKAAQVSFDDYYKTWTGIATSKPKQESLNPLLEAIKDHNKVSQHGLPIQDLQMQMEQQIEEHNALMYGKFKKPQPATDDSKNAKLDRLNKMKKIYLQPRSPRKTPTMSTTPTFQDASDIAGYPPGGTVEGEQDEWEEQVEDLVSWSQKLDADLL